MHDGVVFRVLKSIWAGGSETTMVCKQWKDKDAGGDLCIYSQLEGVPGIGVRRE